MSIVLATRGHDGMSDPIIAAVEEGCRAIADSSLSNDYRVRRGLESAARAAYDAASVGKGLITPEEAAERLGVHRATLINRSAELERKGETSHRVRFSDRVVLYVAARLDMLRK